ncbi:MAG: alpha/beta hydrolase-fold protein [Novosphingobium sp.]
MKALLLASCLAASTLSMAAVPVAAQTSTPAPRPVEVVELKGPQDRAYRISIAIPDGPAPASGFPVVYVLDANALFPTVRDSARMQSFRPSWTGIEPAVVVGIGYPTEALFDVPARTFDLTTPLPDTGKPGPRTGGANAFLAFIEQQVKPLVAGKAPLDKGKQTLLGHSLGGLFVLHTLFSHPQDFTNYVAISPSVWWNEGSLFTEAEAFVRRPLAGHPRLLMTIGEYEQPLSPAARAASAAAEQQAALEKFAMVDGVTRMAKVLGGKSGLTVRHKVLQGEDHGSSAAVGAGLGLRFALLPDAQFEPGR